MKLSYGNFPKSRGKSFLYIVYPLTLNIICFVEKKNWLFLCISESDTVKSDCPMQTFRKIMKYLKI